MELDTKLKVYDLYYIRIQKEILLRKQNEIQNSLKVCQKKKM